MLPSHVFGDGRSDALRRVLLDLGLPRAVLTPAHAGRDGQAE